MPVLLTVGMVAVVIWAAMVGFALALANTAKNADRAGSRLTVPPRGVTPAPHPIAR